MAVIDFARDVTLEPITIDHLKFLRRCRNDERIYKWCRTSRPVTEDEHMIWFYKLAEASQSDVYVIKDDGNLVGSCALSIDRPNNRAEFSLYIDPSLHKLGYGKKSLKTLFDRGFKNLDLNLIWGECFDKNPALKLFLDCGMRIDGYRRDFYFKNNKYIGAMLVSITETEWAARCSV